jgi:hypothetical protein
MRSFACRPFAVVLFLIEIETCCAWKSDPKRVFHILLVNKFVPVDCS